MSHYHITKAIPPCLVTKKLVKQLQDQILQYAADLDSEYSPSHLRIWIHDTDGRETLHGIEEFRNETFSSDTNSITIKYSAPIRSNSELEITVRFSEYSPLLRHDVGSCVEFAFRNDKARETVVGHTNQLIGIIQQAQCYHFFNSYRYVGSGWVVWGLLLTYWALILSRFMVTEPAIRDALHAVAMWVVFAWCAIMVYLGISVLFIPYSLFDSPSVARRLDAIKYYSRTYGLGLVGAAAIKAAWSQLFPS